MSYKLLSNSVFIGTANTVYNATAVLVTANNTNTSTLVVANTGSSQNSTDPGQHGQYDGGQVSVRISQGTVLLIRKRPQDTIQLTNGFATKVAAAGT